MNDRRTHQVQHAHYMCSMWAPLVTRQISRQYSSSAQTRPSICSLLLQCRHLVHTAPLAVSISNYLRIHTQARTWSLSPSFPSVIGRLPCLPLSPQAFIFAPSFLNSPVLVLFVWWLEDKNGPNAAHACRKRRLLWVPSAWGYSWVTLSPGVTNTEAWTSRLGAGSGVDSPTT
jgi:hypothetical protein